MKRILAGLLSLMLVFACVSFATADEKVEKIKVAYMITMNPAEERDLVQAEINRVLAEKGLNVEIEFVCIEFAAWGTQINLMLTDGSIDLFNCSFMDPVSKLAENGAIAPLDDLLAKYGQGIVDTLGDYINCAKFGGITYGCPKLAPYSGEQMFVMNAEVAEKSGVDASTIKDLPTLTEALKKIKAQYPELTAISSGVGGNYYGPGSLDNLGTTYPYACLKLQKGVDDLTVQNYYASEDFKALLKQGKEWVDLGFFRKDAVNGQDGPFNWMQNAEAVGAFAAYASPAVSNGVYSTGFSYPIVSVPVQNEAWATTDNVTGMTWCIPELSTKKEAAMKFLNALFTDSDISNLCCNGIEGVHYVKTEEGNITFAREDQNALTTGWPSGMGTFWPNMLITYPWAPSAADAYDEWRATNDTCEKSPALGFVFDTTNVVDEIAACNNVVSKYFNVMMLAIGDTDAMLADFLNDLDANGVNDIIAEKQSQLNAWVAAQ